MKAGFTALQLVADAMREERRWHDCTALETALAARRIADALRLSERDRALLGCQPVNRPGKGKNSDGVALRGRGAPPTANPSRP